MNSPRRHIQARIQELVKGGGGHFSKFSSRVAKMSISISLAYSHGAVYIRLLLAIDIKTIDDSR